MQKNSDTFFKTQEDALALMQSARLMASARKSADEKDLVYALDNNLRLWTAIQTLVKDKNHTFPREIKESLKNLAAFVIGKTLEKGGKVADSTLDTLENINLQIAEGLLENIAPSAYEQNAFALMDAVETLNEAQKTGNSSLTVQALDKNLHLWTAFLTLLETKNNGIPEQAADNLKRLGHFIVQKTLEAGKTLKESDLELLTRLNLQIAEGFLENRSLTPTQQDAFALLQAAVSLSEAQEKNDLNALDAALEKNLELWTAIRTFMQQKDHPMAQEIKDNLIRLADFTARKTLEIGKNPAQNSAVSTLINLNLQISEGLLERVCAA